MERRIFLVLLAGLAFLYGIYKACKLSLGPNPTPGNMPGFLSDLVTSIAAVLATNFGAVLGLPPARAALFSLSSAGAESLFTGDLTDVAQRVACWLYMIGLVAAAIVWAIKNFTTDDKQIVPLIPQLTRSLIGVAIGALAVILKVHQ